MKTNIHTKYAVLQDLWA